ncbi:group II intron reverse transcriptase/maturase [Planococcus lenghuensis]|nr:group II intron reverse transcriptase/maturase [Planococcus lenghuensis]
MYQESKEGKSLNGLYEVIINDQTIITAIHDIKSNKGSMTAGIDNKTINHFLQMPREKLIRTVRRAMENYNPQPARRKHIPKGNTGKTRPLGIPTMLDRIIQQCIKIVIEPIIEAKLYEHSYGFRPYRSTHHAIARVAHLINIGRYEYVIEGDIKGYFDNIDHAVLMRKLHKIGIIDKRVLALIKKMLKSGIIEEDFKFHDTDKGTPQGGIISPILANVYLNDFDWTVSSRYENPYFADEFSNVKNARRKFRKVGRQPVFLVRYADDWVIFTKTKEQAEKQLEYLKRYFKAKLNLELSEEKTVITDLKENRMKFLGFQVELAKPRKSIGRTGNAKKHELYARILPDMKKVRTKTAEILKDIKQIRRTQCDYQKAVIIEKVNSKIVGLSEYYKTAVWTEIFDSLDHKVFVTSHYTWKKLYRNQNNGKNKAKLKRYSELSNRRKRHEGYTAETHAVEVEGEWVGITKFLHTKSEDPQCFNQNLTPYTVEGRELYYKNAKKNQSLNRLPLYDKNEDVFRIAKRNMLKSDKKNLRKYNFEFYMNREYAFNRDRGKCKVCAGDILPVELQCHHISPTLPLDEVNKITNLASLHKKCHELVHGTSVPEDTKIAKKVEKYRAKLIGDIS